MEFGVGVKDFADQTIWGGCCHRELVRTERVLQLGLTGPLLNPTDRDQIFIQTPSVTRMSLLSGGRLHSMKRPSQVLINVRTAAPMPPWYLNSMQEIQDSAIEKFELTVHIHSLYLFLPQTGIDVIPKYVCSSLFVNVIRNLKLYVILRRWSEVFGGPIGKVLPLSSPVLAMFYRSCNISIHIFHA